ncbi:hypothetical protein [Epibacterium ulvae]|uniref:hypothetical protein n=1 Tax=Epibacterium ulvae TaxID=1156985 RepID=UPI00248FED86|nr:hypothetical protein [Epibacterium ulvae]
MPFCFLTPGAFTGGPMALHQAAARLNALGGQASVMYITDKELGAGLDAFSQEGAGAQAKVRMRKGLRQSRPDRRLDMFEVPQLQAAPLETHFIVPEVWPDLASALVNHGCPNVHIWWLSVDNFPLNLLNQLVNQRLIRACNNLCQSAYAADFVRKNGAQNVSMLSDFVELDEVKNPKPIAARSIDIAYLPAKARGAEPLLDALGKDFKIVPLQNMTRDQVVETLSDSKIFLDCGNHPGKDRVPREAALCGAIPVVRHEGAARFTQDVPLPETLLIETESFFSVDQMRERIQAVLNASKEVSSDLARYREIIKRERAVFDTEIAALIEQDQTLPVRKI